MNDPKSAVQQFGRSAEAYLTSQAHARPDELALAVSQFGLTGDQVVDVGTGAGHVAYALAPVCTKVFALDPTPEMLEVVDREAAKRGFSNIETVLGTAEDLPFGAASLDGVTCRTAAHHFLDVGSFVASCTRVTKQGAWLWVSDTVSPEQDDLAAELDALERLRDPSHVWNLKPSEWREHLEQWGWEVLSFERGAKEIDLEQWLDRMHVEGEDRTEATRRAIHPSVGLAEFLNPRTVDGRPWFDLPDLTFFARKT